MRRILINDLTSDMVLAKSIYHNSNLILAKGTDNLDKYTENFEAYGIFSVYVDDIISEDIHIDDVVCDETRENCEKILLTCIKAIENQGKVESAIVDEMVNSILNDLLSREDVIVSMADIGAKDDATLIHSISTSVYSVLAARKLGIEESELRELAEGALFHDFGKILISSDILLKKGRLTEDEFINMKNHPQFGYDMLSRYTNISEKAKLIALEHHERLDGSGYPRGLVGNQISYLSKIVAIADVYDALTAERCYRKSMTNYKAYSILKSDVGIKYDEDIFEKFMMNVAIYPNGNIVNLSNGLHGIVKEQNIDNQFRPIIRVIDDSDKDNIKLYDLDLAQNKDIEIVE